MQFSLLVLGSPTSTQSATTALRFATAAIGAGHSIFRVFFYHDAVNVANELICPPQDEINISQQWQLLAQKNDIDMVVCVASALKRGILDTTEAERYDKPSANLNEGFDISGLGQLVEASISSDRIVTFGP